MNLHVVGPFDAWPGTLTEVDLACEGEIIITPGFAVDLPGDGWSFFSVQEFFEAYPGANTGGLEFHPATSLRCDADGGFDIFVSEPPNDVIYGITACCSTSIATQALALKFSAYPLTPGEFLPCGAEAIFKWLFILAQADEALAWTTLTFEITIRDAGNTVSHHQVLYSGVVETKQMVKKWPEDFIGLTIGGKTLVANNVTPGPDEYNVSFFDGGEVDILVRASDAFESSIEQTNTFVLPGTECGEESESESFSYSIPESPSESEPLPCEDFEMEVGEEQFPYVDEPFEYRLQIIGGTAPFAIAGATLPDWLTAEIDGDELVLSGTPELDDVVEQFDVEVTVSNCDGANSHSIFSVFRVREYSYLWMLGTADISDYPGPGPTEEDWWLEVRDRPGSIKDATAIAAKVVEWYGMDVNQAVYGFEIDKNLPYPGATDGSIANPNSDFTVMFPSLPPSGPDDIPPAFYNAGWVPSFMNDLIYDVARNRFQIVTGIGRAGSWFLFDKL